MEVPAGETSSSTSNKERGETSFFPTALRPTKSYSPPTVEHLCAHCSSSPDTWEQMAERYFTPLNRTWQFKQQDFKCFINSMLPSMLKKKKKKVNLQKQNPLRNTEEGLVNCMFRIEKLSQHAARWQSFRMVVKLSFFLSELPTMPCTLFFLLCRVSERTL